jgi:hypothetical protein
MRNACKIVVEELRGKRPFGRPRCKCEDNIKTDLKETGLMVWTELNWLRIRSGDGLR